MRYKEYKKVDLPWLEEVPGHWEIKNVNNLFDERREKVSDKDYPPLSVTKNGILPQLENVAKSMESDNRKKVLKGDFVINSRSDRKGSSGLSSYDGSVSLISTVIKPRLGFNKFWHYLLKSNDFIEEFYRNGKGIVADLWTTNFQSMKSIILPFPPKEEQEQIARFLDWKINEIDRLIEIKKKKINELKILKKQIISKLVTQGLKNKNIEKCDYDWIKYIPHNWKIKKLKFIGNVQNGLIYDVKNLSDDGTIVLRSSNIQNGELSLKDNVYLSNTTIEKKFLLQKGDILICSRNGSRDLVGKNILIDDDNKYSFGAFMCRFRSEYNQYLYWVFNSTMFDYYMSLFSTATINQLTNNNLKCMLIPFPEKKEQTEIAMILNNKSKLIRKIFLNLQSQINNLKLLKQSLISDVVTGKIDVRNIDIPDYDKVSDIEYDFDEEE